MTPETPEQLAARIREDTEALLALINPVAEGKKQTAHSPPPAENSRSTEIAQAGRDFAQAHVHLVRAVQLLQSTEIHIPALIPIRLLLPELPRVAGWLEVAEHGVYDYSEIGEVEHSRPFLFLDFDGVLNTYASSPSINPAALERINVIGHETGAVVVLSTSWRYRYSLPELRTMLEVHGLAVPVVGVTPQLLGTRGLEVLAWLRRYAGANPAWVALDDLPPVVMWSEEQAEHRANHVYVQPEHGLTDDHITAVIDRLQGVSPP